MASSNIKLFDENKGNMLSDSEFNISTQRLNGLQTGVASSQLQNKAMYQASLVAYAIAQIMLQNGLNANDTDAVSAFVANLSGAMLQKVYDIATTAEAQAGVATGKWMSPALVKTAIDALAAKAQNILSDETKTLLGLGKDSVPDNAFASLKNLIDSNYSELSSLANSKARFELGTYTGNGNTRRTFNCSFKPVLLILTQTYVKPSNSGGAMVFVRCDITGSSGYSLSGERMIFNTSKGNSVTIEGDNANTIANSAQSVNTNYLLKWNYCFIG